MSVYLDFLYFVYSFVYNKGKVLWLLLIQMADDMLLNCVYDTIVGTQQQNE